MNELNNRWYCCYYSILDGVSFIRLFEHENNFFSILFHHLAIDGNIVLLSLFNLNEILLKQFLQYFLILVWIAWQISGNLIQIRSYLEVIYFSRYNKLTFFIFEMKNSSRDSSLFNFLFKQLNCVKLSYNIANYKILSNRKHIIINFKNSNLNYN